MSIGRIGAAHASSDHALGTSSTSSASDSSSDRFATMLAGALTPPHAPPAPRRPEHAPKDSSASTDGDRDVDQIDEHDDDARSAASASASVNATPSEPAKPAEPTKSVENASATLGAAAAGLDPALQQKVERVIARMKTEFGRDVTVVEGVRSQGRQNQLFAQGRTTDGPVVTWTRNSKHTQGRAVDVTIGGGYDDADGFALLQRVAEQEGLHTLGARDPGHLELGGARGIAARAGSAPNVNVIPSGNANGNANDIVAGIGVARVARVATVAAVSPVASVAQVASVASVAPVAQVAAVAQVAQVATVATPARPGTSASAPRTDAPLAKTSSPLVAGVMQRAATDGGASTGTGGRSGAGTRDGLAKRENAADRAPAAARGDASTDLRAGERAYGIMDRSSALGDAPDSALLGASADVGSTSAARAERAMDAQDAAGPRTLSRLTLSLDDGMGGRDQVRIGMRGGAVGASFEMRDAFSADRVSGRLGELTRALEQRGLEPQTFQVRTTTAARDADVGRGAMQVNDAQRSVATASSARNDTRSDLGGDARQRTTQQDDQQERARREQDEQRRRGSTFSLDTDNS